MDQAGVITKYVIDYDSVLDLILDRPPGKALCLIIGPEVGEHDYKKIKVLAADRSNRTRILNPRSLDAEYAHQMCYCVSSLESLCAIKVRPGQYIIVEIKGPSLTKEEYDTIAKIALAKGFAIKNLFQERQSMYYSYDFLWPLSCITCSVVGALWYRAGCPPLVRVHKDILKMFFP